MKVKIKSKIPGKYTYGDFVKSKQSRSIVVFLSGLSGSKDYPLFAKAHKEFSKNGFSTLRLNFSGENRRQHNNAPGPEDMSLSVYTTGLKHALDKIVKGNSRIILVGHSFGAIMSILFLDKHKKYQKNTELILWDPTLLPWKKRAMEIDFRFDAKKKLYYGENTKEIMNKTFYKECIETKNTADVLGTINKKVFIIAAKHGAAKDARKYFSKLKNKKYSELFIIKNAGHHFETREARKVLFDKTLKFLKN